MQEKNKIGWARFQEGIRPRKTMPFSVMSGTYNLAEPRMFLRGKVIFLNA